MELRVTAAGVPGFRGGATFDASERFRFHLWREWGEAPRAGVFLGGMVLFVMLNPSTADAEVLDPTVRRCLGYARAWGFDRLEVANLFAIRSTDPAGIQPDRALPPEPVEIAATNLAQIIDCATRATLIVCAWGAHGKIDRRGETVAAALRAQRVPLHCLGQNQDGTPVHPLYQPSDQPLIPFPAPGGPVSPRAARARMLLESAPTAHYTADDARFIRGTSWGPPPVGLLAGGRS